MKLIFNADDFGYSRGINFGIADAFALGVVRSATFMAGMPGAEHAAELYKIHAPNGFGVGVHLTLTCGFSVNGAKKTITNADGSFFKQGDLYAKLNDINASEVEDEWNAQIERAISLGIKPTHLDSHHHIHLTDRLFMVAQKLAQKYKLPLRLPENFTADFFGDNATEEFLIKLIHARKNEDKFLEIMCHPAYLDAAILEGSSYNTARCSELRILTSAPLLNIIKENNIELCNYEKVKL